MNHIRICAKNIHEFTSSIQSYRFEILRYELMHTETKSVQLS